MRKGDKGKKILGVILIFAIIVSVFGGVVSAEDVSGGLTQSVADAEIQTALGNLSSVELTEALDADPLHQLPATSGKISYFCPDCCPASAWGEPLGVSCEGDDAARYWFVAMRWPYYDPCTGFLDMNAKSWWHNKKVLVTNPANGKQVVLAVKDWGPCNACIPDCPQSAQERVVDVSKTALDALGAVTDDIVNIEFADQSARVGDVGTLACPPPNEQCGTETDDCFCGAPNPCYCCDNDGGGCDDPCDGNCVWWAWQEACCNWGVGENWCGDAKNWASEYASRGYPVSDIAAVSTIAVKTTGGYGHVAWVIGVSGDEVTVREMNCCEVSPSCSCSGESNANCVTCGPGNPNCPDLGVSVRSCTYPKSFFDKYIYQKGSVLPPPAPTLDSPGSNSYPGPTITTLTPWFNWNSVPTADYYGLYIRDLDADVLVFNSQVDYGPIYGTSFPLPSGILNYGTHYRWNMNSHNSAGWGDYSDRLWFTTYEADEIPPVVEFFDVSPDSVTLGEEFTITYIVSDTGGSGLKQTELWRANDVNGEPDWPEDPIQITPLPGYDSYAGGFYDAPPSEGTYWYGLHVVDNAENWGWEPDPPGPIEVEVTPSDTTPPPPPILSSSTHPNENNWYNNNDPLFTWTTPSDASGIAGYSYTIDHSSSTTPDTSVDTTGNSKSYTNLADGTWYFHVRAKDNAGNWGNADHYRVKIDTANPPAPTISSSTHPNENNWYNNNDPSFTWTTPSDTSGIAGYSYTIDHSSSTTPDTSVDTTGNSKSYTNLADGTWYFHVRAKDNAGNWGSTDHYRVKIDTNDPPNTPSIPSGPTLGQIGISYTYSTVTTDPNSDNVYYWFDWGDDTNSGWIGPYPSGTSGSAAKEWSNPDTYNVKAKAKDEHGDESSPLWSDPLPVCINGLWEDDPINLCKKRRLTCTGEYEYQNKDDGTICGCTASNTLKRCYGGVCTDTGICDATTCGADAACDGKEPGDSCGGGICNSVCECRGQAVGEDIAAYSNGLWLVNTNGDHQTVNDAFWYGASGETPVVGDINQDGTDDIATYNNGRWLVSTDGNHGTINTWFWYGASGETPVVGDINQDGTDDIATYNNGRWLVSTDGNPGTVNMWFWYGASGETPVVGDINQDGTDDIATYNNGRWLVSTDVNPGTIKLWFWYGTVGQTPVVGDIG